jgi:hypothetical protein
MKSPIYVTEKRTTHELADVRNPATIKKNRNEHFSVFPELVKLLTWDEKVVVNEEITPFIYTHFLLCCDTIQRTAMSDLAPQSGATHTSTTSPIRNPSTGAALPLRGGLASIERETKFLPASD